jgi:hypothetical protein
MKDMEYIGYHRHPKNKFGQGSNEFYEEQYRLHDCTRKEYWDAVKASRPKCPVCGTPQGFSFGTGDCGCLG